MNNSFNQTPNSTDYKKMYQHFPAWYRTKGWAILKSFYPIGLLISLIVILFCGDSFRNFISVNLFDSNAVSKLSTDADFLVEVETVYESGDFQKLISYFLVENWATYLPFLFGGLGVGIVLYLFVGPAIELGNTKLYLGLVDGEHFSIKNSLKTLFSPFLTPLLCAKSLLVRLMKTGMQLACFVPSLVTLILMVLLVENPVLLASVYLLSMALLIGGAVLALVVELSYYYTSAVLVENPELSAVQVMKTTRKMMKGNKLRLVSLFFSMILYFLASYLLNFTILGIYLPIGEILLGPILSAFTMVFYNDISDRKKWYKDAMGQEYTIYQ